MLWPLEAVGQPVCNPRANVLERLAEKYQEAPVAVGIANSGALVEVLTTSDGRTWSIIVTRSDGWTCLVAAGEGWRRIDSPLPEGTAL